MASVDFSGITARTPLYSSSYSVELQREGLPPLLICSQPPLAEHRLRQIYSRPDASFETSLNSEAGGVFNTALDWVSAHDESLRPALQELISRVRYVSHEVFLERLGESIRNIQTQLQILGEFEWARDAVFMVEGHKSNKWVADIAATVFRIVPAQVCRLGTKGAGGFVEYLGTVKPKDLKTLFAGKTMVLLDDGAFSGKQLSEHVEMIQECSQKNGLKIKNIAIITPFMTEVAEARILGTKPKSPKKGVPPVVLSQHERIPSLADLSEETKNTLLKMWRLDGPLVGHLGLTWFSHKIPNDQSFPKQLVKASVYNADGDPIKKDLPRNLPKIISPYKSNDALSCASTTSFGDGGGGGGDEGPFAPSRGSLLGAVARSGRAFRPN